MSLQFIIDGCNIIHHPLFSHTSSKKSTDKRAALLELINFRRLSGSQRNKVVVVFDGFPGQDLLRQLDMVCQDISIIFSGKISADDKIRKIVENSANNANTVIVSDDKEIKFLSRIFRAQYRSVEEFLEPRKESRRKAADPEEGGISYTQKERINRELRGLWLKP